MTNRVISFFETIGHELKSIFTSTTWEQKVLSTLAYTEPFIVGILTLADPAIAPFVTGVINAVVADLTTVKTIVQQGTVAPGSSEAVAITTALDSVKSNLNGLLADAHVKNSASVAKITAAVDLVNGEVDAILQEAPVAEAA